MDQRTKGLVSLYHQGLESTLEDMTSLPDLAIESVREGRLPPLHPDREIRLLGLNRQRVVYVGLSGDGRAINLGGEPLLVQPETGHHLLLERPGYELGRH